MEQVTLSSLPSDAFIRGSQALLLHNNSQNLNLSACLKGDIIQQALSGINTQITPAPDVNSQKVNIGQNGFILDKDEAEDVERVVQLSISDDFPLHLLNSSRSEDNIFSADHQSILLEDVLNSANDKSDNSLDSLNSLLQISPENGSSDVQDAPLPSVKGNFAYAYQLTNGTKISPISQNVSASAVNTSSNGFSNVTSLSPAFVDASKSVPETQNSVRYVILHGVNLLKPRFVLNVNKNNLGIGKNNAQKVQLLPVGGKVMLNKNPKNIPTQKVARSPLKKPKLKEALNQSPSIRLTQNQELNANKSAGTSILLASLLKRKAADEQSPVGKDGVNSPVQIIQNINGVEVQEKLLPTSVILQPNVTNISNFQSFPIESSLQVIQDSECVELQEKLLPTSVILQPTVTDITNFQSSPSTTEGQGKNLLIKDSGLIAPRKVLLTKVVPRPKVNKPTESHSVPGRCTEDQLKKLQDAFKNGELPLNGSNNSSVIYDQETKIVCKLLYPEEFLQKDGTEEDKSAEMNGKKPKKRVGRPPNNIQKEEVEVVPRKIKKIKVPRTRSGRLSRPPQYMMKDFKKISIHHSDISSAESEIDENVESINEADTNLPKPDNIATGKVVPKFMRCPTCGKNYPGSRMLLHFAKYPEHGDPSTLYLKYPNLKDKTFTFKQLLSFRGKQQAKYIEPGPLRAFLASCSDELLLTAIKDRVSKILSPWDYLMERQSAGEGAVKGLLSDLSEIINALPPDMLEKTVPSNPKAIHITDEKLCQVLNISQGSYLPNDSAIKPSIPEEPPPPEIIAPPQNCSLPLAVDDSMPVESMISMNEMLPVNQVISNSEVLPMNQVMQGNEVLPMNHIMSSDEDLPSNDVMSSSQDEDNLFGKDENSLDLDKKVSSDLSDILLDKSSIDTVDEILNDRLNELMPLDVPPLGEGPALTRSIFSTSSLELHGVSGSTEDLLKSLENLAPELPPVTEPPDFDFSVLSTDFVTDR